MHADPPPAEVPDGHATIWNGDEWTFDVDKRGTKVYLKATGEEYEQSSIGDISDDFTEVKPEVPFPVWKEYHWENDDVAEMEQKVRQADETKSSLSDNIESRIRPLEYANKLGVITDEEKALLDSLMMSAVKLHRIDTSSPDEIVWPELP